MEVEMSLKEWSYPFGTGEQAQREDAVTRFRALLNYYRANAIWLDQRTSDSLESFVKETYNLFRGMDALTDPNLARREMNLPGDPAQRAKIRDDAINRAHKQLPTIREQLGEEFKSLLKLVDPSAKTLHPAARFYKHWTS